jgi:hypothetical protein
MQVDAGSFVNHDVVRRKAHRPSRNSKELKLTTTYIISLDKMAAVAYSGKMHHMSIRAATRRFSDDAFVVSYCGEGHLADDLLKVRSSGPCSLSVTERELIKSAAAQ